MSRYGLAVLVVGVALAFKMFAIPVTGRGAPFVFFIGSVLITSFFGGIGPGLLSLILAAPLGGYL